MALIMMGLALGLLARAVLGDPEPELPPKPHFSAPLADEVPLAFPIIEP